MKDRKKRAKTLLEALPYIQKFNGKTVVIKYGGNAMLNEDLKNSVMRDIVLLSIVGIKVVLVHGGGPELSSMLKQLGKESVFVDGLRYTDKETAEIAAMVLAGKVNKSLVSLIHSNKGKALGICGVDGGMIGALPKEDMDLGYVGDIISINPEPINVALNEGFIPVVATIGVDDDGQLYNINADTAAANIASSLRAEKLVLMTDVRGVLEDVNDENTLIPKIKKDEVFEYVNKGIISGGMIPKIESAVLAMDKGLNEAVIIDGRIEHSILLELFSDSGIGTLFTR
jgi:acetylglutamate kinase